MPADSLEAAKAIAKLRRLHRRGVQMNCWAVKKVDPKLARSVLKHFGIFRKAAEAAGLPARHRRPERNWTPQLVIDSLRELHRQGVQMRYLSIQEADRSLAPSCPRFFGTFRNAVERAGLPYVVPRNQTRVWSRDRVLEALRKLHDQGVTMNYAGVNNLDHSLAATALKYFSHFRDAVEAAGIEYPMDHGLIRCWRKDDVLAALRKLHEQGTVMSATEVLKVDKGLAMAARRRWKSFEAAVKAAGLPFVRKQGGNFRWTPEDILQGLRELHQKGTPMALSYVRQMDPHLYTATHRHFGSFRLAVEAAGLPYINARNTPLKKRIMRTEWTEQKVLQTLRQMHSEDVDLRFRNVKTKYQALFWAAVKLFGAYVIAIREAGIDYWTMSQVHLARQKQMKRDESGQTGE